MTVYKVDPAAIDSLIDKLMDDAGLRSVMEWRDEELRSKLRDKWRKLIIETVTKR